MNGGASGRKGSSGSGTAPIRVSPMVPTANSPYKGVHATSGNKRADEIDARVAGPHVVQQTVDITSGKKTYLLHVICCGFL